MRDPKARASSITSASAMVRFFNLKVVTIRHGGGQSRPPPTPAGEGHDQPRIAADGPRAETSGGPVDVCHEGEPGSLFCSERARAMNLR